VIRDRLHFTTDWMQDERKGVWRKAVAMIDVGEGLPEISYIVAIEAPPEIDREHISVVALRMDEPSTHSAAELRLRANAGVLLTALQDLIAEIDADKRVQRGLMAGSSLFIARAAIRKATEPASTASLSAEREASPSSNTDRSAATTEGSA